MAGWLIFSETDPGQYGTIMVSQRLDDLREMIAELEKDLRIDRHPQNRGDRPR